MHVDFLKAKREQAKARYDQLRHALDQERATVQRREVEAINQEGYLRALDELILEEEPAVELDEALKQVGVEEAPDR